MVTIEEAIHGIEKAVSQGLEATIQTEEATRNLNAVGEQLQQMIK